MKSLFSDGFRLKRLLGYKCEFNKILCIFSIIIFFWDSISTLEKLFEK